MHTSANVDGNVFDEIGSAAIKFAYTESKIFKDAAKLGAQAIKCGLVIGRLTEYQDHCPERWEKLDYSVSAEEIEFFTSARQKYKISVSKLAFIGFLFFWDVLMLKYADKLCRKVLKFELRSYEEYRKLFKEKMECYILRFKLDIKT